MESDAELMAEHKAFDESYEGSFVAPLPEYPEKEGPMKSWEHWKRQQEESLEWFNLSDI